MGIKYIVSQGEEFEVVYDSRIYGAAAANSVLKVDGDGVITINGGTVVDLVTDGAVTAAKLASDSVTTVKILDANVTSAKLSNLLYGTTTRSGVGAVPITHRNVALTSTGSAQAITLADGAVGQRITMYHDVDGGSMVLTPATKSGYTTITFTAVGETATLLWTATRGWVVEALYLAVAA